KLLGISFDLFLSILLILHLKYVLTEPHTLFSAPVSYSALPNRRKLRAGNHLSLQSSSGPHEVGHADVATGRGVLSLPSIIVHFTIPVIIHFYIHQPVKRYAFEQLCSISLIRFLDAVIIRIFS